MNTKTCFVISPIGHFDTPERTRADKVLQKVIEPALKGTIYRAIRADQIAKPGDITTEIIEHLVDADLVIADLTGHNPNVFYELAIRHATRKPVIAIIHKDESIPFDVLQFRTIFYDTDDGESVKGCITDIQNQIKTVELGLEKIVNPVSIAVDIKDLSRKREPLERRYTRLAKILEKLTSEIQELKARTPYQNLIDSYRDEIDMLRSLREAGIISTYRRREMALKNFTTAIEDEKNEIVVIGSSLLGLLQKYQYELMRNKLKEKSEANVQVKFLLTHPAVADLRADQEARKFKDIGKEIIKSLTILRDWKIPADNVRLYMGTPTIFAIKTTEQMLLNPYAYGDVAFNSPCIIVKNDPTQYFYFYDEYDKAHFGAWDSDAVIRIKDFDTTIQSLEGNLELFEKNIQTIRESVRGDNEPVLKTSL